MRISDWSSDVCSSDLLLMSLAEEGEGVPAEQAAIVGWLSRVHARDLEEFRDLSQLGEQVVNELLHHVRDCVTEGASSVSLDAIQRIGRALRATVRSIEGEREKRSEEHTSELQSL